MPSYKLTDTAWLNREKDRVKGVLLVHLKAGQTYTGAELLQTLKDFGLEYTAAELVTLRDALIVDGTLEAVV
ncbi:MAG: hypothetical protein ACE5LU_25575 [Anaerolineae bacterium]